MTKDEFREFVRTVIVQSTVTVDTVNTIVAQWESDVNDARIAGQNETDPNFIDSTISTADACMGPCCGGSI